VFRLGLVLAIVLAALDQLSKWLILTEVMTPPRVIELTGFFNLVLVGNRGISFGLFSNNWIWGQPLMAGLAFTISVVLLFWLKKADNRLLASGLGLVIGGAIGNGIDRLAHGAVIDFLDFHVMGYHWPAFNVADAGIVVGVGLILLEGLFAGPGKTR